jgi:hypothetical protein
VRTRIPPTAEAKLETLERQINRAVAAIIQGHITEGEADRHLPELRRQRADVAAELALLGEPPKVISLRTAIVDDYLGTLQSLPEILNGDLAAGGSEAATAIRSLIETVTVMPTPRGLPPGLKVAGNLAPLLTLDRPQNAAQIGGQGGAG